MGFVGVARREGEGKAPVAADDLLLGQVARRCVVRVGDDLVRIAAGSYGRDFDSLGEVESGLVREPPESLDCGADGFLPK
jgi:hypothetical protein